MRYQRIQAMNFSTLLLILAALTDYSSAAPAKVFSPLQCNSDINTEECINNAVDFSTLFSEGESRALTIPCGQCVVMDYADGSTIDIPGGLNVIGRLHFNSESSVTLRTTAVFVQGTWSMETPKEGKNVKVALYGSGEKTFYPHTSCCENYSNGLDPIYGYDCSCSPPEGMGRLPFMVAGGQLDIRAFDEDCLSWTKLKEVTSEQSIKVDTAFAKCLRPGDDLLFTSDQRAFKEHEKLVVESVDKATGDVVLQTAMPRVFPAEIGGWEPEFAIEVALLRRDVVFTAESDPTEDWIGGHSIIYHTPNVVQTIQGVQFDNFGQGGVKGRYPVHFHMSGDTESLVSKNIIVNSNQRCVFIHDTNKVTVDDNVAFDTKGHCYATETGNEEYNKFTRNLGAYTRKLAKNRDNGASDSNGKSASTFWIRNMKNTFTGNVAAGCVDTGFWLEMKNIHSNQLNDDSFKDNSVHSSFRGLLTYKKGWKPSQPAVIEGFKAYLTDEGSKFHITGNLALKNCLFSDNQISVRYGVWNSGVTFENTKFVGLSKDQKKRMGKNCPRSHGHAIRASMNNYPKNYGALVLKDVEFSDFTCETSRTITSYYDNRLSFAMGDPIQAENVTIVNTNEKNRPRLNNCKGSAFAMWFMEDVDGTLGPPGKGPGFLVRNRPMTTALFPEGSCEPLWYDNSKCTTFCEDVCLRLIHLQPTGSVKRTPNSNPDDIQKLRLTNPLTNKSATYNVNEYGKAVILLPTGTYDGEFLNSAGNPIVLDTVKKEAFRRSQCSDNQGDVSVSRVGQYLISLTNE